MSNFCSMSFLLFEKVETTETGLYEQQLAVDPFLWTGTSFNWDGKTPMEKLRVTVATLNELYCKNVKNF